MDIKNNRRQFFFGTWKNKLTPSTSVALAKQIASYLNSSSLPFEFSICPPMLALQAVSKEAKGFSITSQNLIWDDTLSYTGETSAESLVEVGCKYVMIGHSERRLYLGENDVQVSKKVSTSINHGLIPLICIGESFEDYNEGRIDAVVTSQIDSLIPTLKTCSKPSQFIIAYEPAWAITTSKQAIPCDPNLAEERHKFIRNIFSNRLGAEFAENISIIYGAGVNIGNIKEFLKQPNIDGGLAGGASQSYEKFVELIEAAREHYNK